jgi:hypothetical protein
LFNPRTDMWEDHFRWERAWIEGVTAIGRATARVLAMNAEDLLSLRIELFERRSCLLSWRRTVLAITLRASIPK